MRADQRLRISACGLARAVCSLKCIWVHTIIIIDSIMRRRSDEMKLIHNGRAAQIWNNHQVNNPGGVRPGQLGAHPRAALHELLRVVIYIISKDGIDTNKIPAHRSEPRR